MYALNIFDFIIVPIYLVMIFLLARVVAKKGLEKESCYKYFVTGLFAKIFGGLGVCLTYIYYYHGGDTIAYFHDVRLLSQLSYTSPANLFYVLKKSAMTSVEWHSMNFFMHDEPYMSRDAYAWFVIKCTWFFGLPALGSFFATVVLINVVTFIPIWKFYKIFVKEFPNLEREFAIAVFFIPSVAFWGSGLLKDNLTFSAVCLYSYAIYNILILKRNYFIHSLQIIFSYYILTSVKPYIFFALLPGSFLWMASILMNQFSNRLIRRVTAPVLLVVAGLTGYFALAKMGDKLGDFNLDNVMTKATATQQDLKQESYMGNSFDIGDFDPTPISMLSKAHLAIIAALFRPFLWEARNPVMLVSGLENFILLLFALYILFKVRVIYLFRLVLKHHLLLFSMVFSLFFAFGVGLSTSNFGSLVRYKIPAMPFFLASLIIAREILFKINLEKELSQRDTVHKLVPQ